MSTAAVRLRARIATTSVATLGVLVAVSSAIWHRPAPAAEEIARHTDLLRLGEHHQEVVSGSPMKVGVWDLDGHYRPVLRQAAPSRSVLGPIPPGRACRLHFALGIAEEAWPRNPGVHFRVDVRRGQTETSVFSEFVGLARGRDRAWRERVVDLPDTGSEPFSLALSTSRADGAASGTRPGWGSPYVVCRVAKRASPDLDRPHVILISLDTLRADHLGVYGYPHATSPVLDAFAQESLVFENVYAPASWTLPTHASMFTGLYPDEHGGGHASTATPLGDGPATLAEILADAGYWTIAFTSGGVMSHSNGLGRGFQWWTERTRANLAATLPGFFDAIGAPPRRPLFLFLHTYDIHGPYAYLPGLPERLARNPADEVGPDAEWQRIRRMGYHRYQLLDRFDGLAETVAAYDAGIRFVDTQLGHLFDRLREVGIYDDSLIIVVSDHGESLYDHQLYLGHTYSLRDHELRVPLIVRFPNGERHGRNRAQASLVDLLPLILDEVGLPVPPGLSGVNPLTPDTPPNRTLWGESSHTGARYGRTPTTKWIGEAYLHTDPRSQLPPGLRDRFAFGEQAYDLGQDPSESDARGPAAKQQPAGIKALRDAGTARGRPGARNGAAVELDPQREKELRALGYVP